MKKDVVSLKGNNLLNVRKETLTDKWVENEFALLHIGPSLKILVLRFIFNTIAM
jgi:hypothetical protein